MVLDTCPGHWARISVETEIESAKAVLNAYQRKLGQNTELSLDELESVTNVFKFSMLGGKGYTWRAGLRTFWGEIPNVLRQRVACLSAIVPLTPLSCIYYNDKDDSPISGTAFYGEALLIESKPSSLIQRVVLPNLNDCVTCLIVTYEGLDLACLSTL